MIAAVGAGLTVAAMKSEQAKFGEQLRMALRVAGMGESGKELADLVVSHGGDAVTPQAAHDWVRGKKFPRPQNIKALAAGLRVSTDRLFGLTDGSLHLGEERAAWPAGNLHDQQAVEAYLSLTPARRQLVRELLKLLSKETEAR